MLKDNNVVKMKGLVIIIAIEIKYFIYK